MKKIRKTEHSRCEVCGNDYTSNQTEMFEWTITPGVSFYWCESCDKEKANHEGSHTWMTAFIVTLVMAIQQLDQARPYPSPLQTA